MARGGKREGGGRKKGQPNKSQSEIRAAALAGGISPLDYMLRVLRDEDADEDRRDRMAQAAAPYLHAKLVSSEMSGEDGGPIKHELTIKFAAGSAAKED